MKSIAQVSGLSQGYGSRQVIANLDLTVPVGVLGLLGPNGAGKSTLLRTLATISPPRAGEVFICGDRITSEAKARRVRHEIGYLPQDFGYFPAFSIQDFVRYCAWLRGVSDKHAGAATDRAIDAVGLTGKRRAKMKTLSGGMLRRAGIASAIVGSPQLLLLDEPTVGLDPAQRLQFRNLIRSQENCAVVLSTHLVEDVTAVCDRVIVMNDGSVLFQGTPEELAALEMADVPGDSPMERGYMTLLSTAEVVAAP